MEQNDPISALAPSLPEFSATGIKGRTKPCNYNPGIIFFKVYRNLKIGLIGSYS
jgi:hypothetical protein